MRLYSRIKRTMRFGKLPVFIRGEMPLLVFSRNTGEIIP